MQKYGFVYIWCDRKHSRYYVGCHWGSEDDRYICSSTWMRDAYRKRPHDFKRRIIKRVYTNRHDLMGIEEYYLGMIDPEELGTKYYNHSNYNIKSTSINGKKTQFKKGHIPHNKGISFKWVTDGIVNRKLPLDKSLPERYKYGKTQTKIFTGKTYPNQTSFKKGRVSYYKDRHYKWITNGLILKRLAPDAQLPDGFHYGRPHPNNTKCGHQETKWITDGTISKRLDIGADLPNGSHYGRL